jgi:hypothetical protein
VWCHPKIFVQYTFHTFTKKKDRKCCINITNDLFVLIEILKLSV